MSLLIQLKLLSLTNDFFEGTFNFSRIQSADKISLLLYRVVASFQFNAQGSIHIHSDGS